VILFNKTPFQFAPMPGRMDYPKHSLTVIIKGTFDLVQGEAAKEADEQLPPVGDEPYPDDEEGTGSPRYESDLVYFKPSTDLLLVGKCHAPGPPGASGGAPTQACGVTFAVGGKSRMLSVTGNRHWISGLLSNSVSPIQPFAEMDLRYENSYGGQGYKQNPVGKGYGKVEATHSQKLQLLPNIEDPNKLVDSTRSRPEPAGFGPLGRAWNPRAKGIGTYGDHWFKTRSPWFPEDIDWSSFNAAPAPMRTEGYLRGDEEIFLENIHPQHAQFRGQLPGLRVRCFLNQWQVEGQDKPDRERFGEVAMNIDTLWIDAEEQKLVLVWRGHAEVLSDEFEEVQHLFVTSEPAEQPPQTVEQCRALFIEELPKDKPIGPPPLPGEEPAEEGTPPEPDAAAPEEEGEDDDDAEINQMLEKHRAQMLAAGMDPDNPPEPTPEEKKETARLMKEWGIEDEEEEEPGPPPPLTRELVQERAERGESFNNEDLSGLDLSGLDLKTIKFVGTKLVKTSLKGANLAEAELSEADLAGADFSDADLTKAIILDTDLSSTNLAKACLKEVNASGSCLAGVDLSGQDLSGAKFNNADMKGVVLDGGTATGADFSGADLTGASLKNSTLESAFFIKANLTEANLEKANLQKAFLDEVVAVKANMNGADLTGMQAWKRANFTGATFRQAVGPGSTWDQAILYDADFSYADMEGVDFTKAFMTRANLYAANMKSGCFRKADLKGARLVEMNLFQGSMEYADLTEADISGSNMYGVEFADAVVSRTRAEGTNYKKTKLYSG